VREDGDGTVVAVKNVVFLDLISILRQAHTLEAIIGGMFRFLYIFASSIIA
jgi:hypothetical protein